LLTVVTKMLVTVAEAYQVRRNLAHHKVLFIKGVCESRFLGSDDVGVKYRAFADPEFWDVLLQKLLQGGTKLPKRSAGVLR
jgi:hypothetical protein